MLFNVTVSHRDQPDVVRTLPHPKDPPTWTIKDVYDFLVLMSLLIRPIGTQFAWSIYRNSGGDHSLSIAVDHETARSPVLALDHAVVDEIVQCEFARVNVTDEFVGCDA
ncbi:MAG TPA: hypothetical protein VI485_28755 [Vicinamibacterales bacterium]|nr:hypothetical protein [Vicinamibacterales bacterium]